MKINLVRSLTEIRSVLKDSSASGPDPAYWVFSEISSGRWSNLTIIPPGTFGAEYTKTFGHYHNGAKTDEIYHLISGQGLLLFQERHFENGAWVPNRVDSVYLIKVLPGEEIVVKEKFGHSWINVGEDPLLSYDDWRSPHSEEDYAAIGDLGGMAYHIVKENGKPLAVPNPRYQNLPEPVWLTTEEFKARQESENNGG